MRILIFAILLFPLLFSSNCSWAADISLAVLLKGAKSGDTINLPAGVYRGSIELPDGVNLHGSDAEKTIIDASGHDVGLLLKGRSTVSGLTVRGAKMAALRVAGVKKATISKSRFMRSLCGVDIRQSSDIRLENLLIAGNRTGLTFNGTERCILINSSLVNNSASGMSISHSQRSIIFNNLISGSDVGIYLPLNNSEMKSDYNLWNCPVIGKMEGEYIRRTLPAWVSLAKQEHHSVAFPVTFANPARDEYWPISEISWRPSHVITAGWGIKTFAGIQAPKTDIRGITRGKDIDVGAYASERRNVGKAAGIIKISSDAGIKSAGIFTKDGSLICYLFQGLPLQKGNYEFWLPGRDFLAKPIAAGNYQIKLVESNLQSEFLGYTSNQGIENFGANANEMHVQLIEYADDGKLIIGNGWQERKINMVAIDPASGKAAWTFGGDAEMCGLITYNKKVILLKEGSGKQDLLQLDMSTGKAVPWPNGDYLLSLPQKVAPYKSLLAGADGEIFLADSENNKIFISHADNPPFDTSFPVESPNSLSGDESTGLVWFISKGEEIQTINFKGNIDSRGKPVAKPVALSCRNNRLAIASAETGKVHIFDATDPNKLKALFTIGTGTDPVGPVSPDRFEFKTSKYSDVAPVKTDLAVGPSGEIAVLHGRRVAMFDPKGQLIRDTWADFCWDMFPVNYGDAAPTGFYNGKGYSFSIDALTKSWQPQAKWAVPAGCTLYRFFAIEGKKYAVGTQLFPKWFANGQNGTGFVICAIDEYVARPISQYLYVEKDKNWQIRRDSNGDKIIDDKDVFSLWKTADGRDMALPTHFASYTYPARDGSLKLLFQPDRPGIDLWPDGQTIRGIIIDITADKNGIPQLVVENKNLPRMAQVTFPSPYNNSEEENISYCAGFNGMLPASDGGWVYFPYLKSSPAMKGNIVNGSGSDLMGVTEEGNLRWFRSLNEAGPAIALSKINDLITVGGCWEAEIYTMTDDGLSTGNFGLPLAAHYRFGLMDHPNVLQPFIGNDGQQYYLMGEFMSNCANWFALRNSDTIRISSKPLRISNTTAEALRALPLKVISTSLPKPPTIMVNKLSNPLPIDGDLVKWRKAGITPQVLLTPDGAGGGVAGPTDACGILRMAYEGDNLYFQVLVFDNQVVQYQPANKFYMQDAIEISLNGYAVGGFKYNLTRVRDEGEYLFRDRWFAEELSRPLDPTIAPRVVKILPDAENVEERQLIESIYGVDLAKSAVIVYECKLPITEVYNNDQKFNKARGLAEYPIQMKSGSSFHFGIQIDDSDEPGADVQHYISWPSSYNTWAPAELHATAIFE